MNLPNKINADSIRKTGISVVVPAYNAASWLPKTVPKINESLLTAKVKNAEIIIVDDGSTDNSSLIAKKIKLSYPVIVLKQKNQGRFHARKTGISKAKYEHILLIDTRVFIDKYSLQHVLETMEQNSAKVVWNAHVNVDKKGNVFARFWDAIVQIAWRKYFSNPREISYGLKEFDYYPKGTTCFFAPKDVLLDAITEFERYSKVDKTSNDDTLMIRNIAKSHNINVSPVFSCLYHARTDIKQFIKHSFHRGQVFVDGFLHPGNRYYLPLILFLILSFTSLILIILKPELRLLFFILFLALWVSELGIALISRIDKKDALSLWILSPLFVMSYGLGIWLATLRRKSYK